MCNMPSSSLSNTFILHFEVFPTPWVSKQSKTGQHYLVVIRHLLFVRFVTNSHVKKPRLLELMPVLSTGYFAEASYMRHPLLHCVLCSSGHGLHDSQVSSTLLLNRIKELRSNMKGEFLLKPDISFWNRECRYF